MNRTTIRKISLAPLVLSAFVFRLAAHEVTNIAEIGSHEPILIVEKNVHPENLMVVYTKVDAHGHFLPDPKNPARPILGFYWLMGGKAYKPVNAIIKTEIRKRLKLELPPIGIATHFVIYLNDLKEVKSDIKQPKINVSIDETTGTRDVEAQMNLGPSDENMRIKLSAIYTEGRAFPPAVYSVTLKGEEIANGKLTGKKVTRTYEAKDRAN